MQNKINIKRILVITIISAFLAIFIPLPWAGLNASYTPLTSFFKNEDAGIVTGDYLMGAGFVRQATSTLLQSSAGTPTNFTAGADGDYSLTKVSEIGGLFTHDVPMASTTLLNELNILWNPTQGGTATRDINPNGFRNCELSFALDSYGTGVQEIQYFLQAKNSAGFYFDVRNGFWGKFMFDDTAVTATTSIAVDFLCPINPFRIYATSTVGGAGVGFNQASTTLSMRN